MLILFFVQANKTDLEVNQPRAHTPRTYRASTPTSSRIIRRASTPVMPQGMRSSVDRRSSDSSSSSSAASEVLFESAKMQQSGANKRCVIEALKVPAYIRSQRGLGVSWEKIEADPTLGSCRLGSQHIENCKTEERSMQSAEKDALNWRRQGFSWEKIEESIFAVYSTAKHCVAKHLMQALVDRLEEREKSQMQNAKRHIALDRQRGFSWESIEKKLIQEPNRILSSIILDFKRAEWEREQERLQQIKIERRQQKEDREEFLRRFERARGELVKKLEKERYAALEQMQCEQNALIEAAHKAQRKLEIDRRKARQEAKRRQIKILQARDIFDRIGGILGKKGNDKIPPEITDEMKMVFEVLNFGGLEKQEFFDEMERVAVAKRNDVFKRVKTFNQQGLQELSQIYIQEELEKRFLLKNI
ncbi:MAG: hypothetical protein H6850_03445 [Alphaproteobacteria bacterium]|nr:MAG: hypothetical protein H6850_03445 [Alphaproteobacteria bacterium]